MKIKWNLQLCVYDPHTPTAHSDNLSSVFDLFVSHSRSQVRNLNPNIFCIGENW